MKKINTLFFILLGALPYLSLFSMEMEGKNKKTRNNLGEQIDQENQSSLTLSNDNVRRSTLNGIMEEEISTDIAPEDLEEKKSQATRTIEFLAKQHEVINKFVILSRNEIDSIEEQLKETVEYWKKEQARYETHYCKDNTSILGKNSQLEATYNEMSDICEVVVSTAQNLQNRLNSLKQLQQSAGTKTKEREYNATAVSNLTKTNNSSRAHTKLSNNNSTAIQQESEGLLHWVHSTVLSAVGLVSWEVSPKQSQRLAETDTKDKKPHTTAARRFTDISDNGDREKIERLGNRNSTAIKETSTEKPKEVQDKIQNKVLSSTSLVPWEFLRGVGVQAQQWIAGLNFNLNYRIPYTSLDQVQYIKRQAELQRKQTESSLGFTQNMIYRGIAAHNAFTSQMRQDSQRNHILRTQQQHNLIQQNRFYGQQKQQQNQLLRRLNK